MNKTWTPGDSKKAKDNDDDGIDDLDDIIHGILADDDSPKNLSKTAPVKKASGGTFLTAQPESDSDISAADPREMTKKMQGMDDMDDALLSSLRKGSTARQESSPTRSSTAPTPKHVTDPPATEKPASAGMTRNLARSLLKGSDDEDDSITDLLTGGKPKEDNSAKPPTPSSALNQRPPTRSGTQPVAGKPTAKPTNNKTDFDDDDDPTGILGLDGDTPKKETDETNKAGDGADSFMASLLGGSSSLSKPASAPAKREFVLDDKYKKPTVGSAGDDDMFGAYAPSAASGSRPSSRRSVRFADDEKKADDMFSTWPSTGREKKPPEKKDDSDWLQMATGEKKVTDIESVASGEGTDPLSKSDDESETLSIVSDPKISKEASDFFSTLKSKKIERKQKHPTKRSSPRDQQQGPIKSVTDEKPKEVEKPAVKETPAEDDTAEDFLGLGAEIDPDSLVIRKPPVRRQLPSEKAEELFQTPPQPQPKAEFPQSIRPATTGSMRKDADKDDSFLASVLGVTPDRPSMTQHGGLHNSMPSLQPISMAQQQMSSTTPSPGVFDPMRELRPTEALLAAEPILPPRMEPRSQPQPSATYNAMSSMPYTPVVKPYNSAPDVGQIVQLQHTLQLVSAERDRLQEMLTTLTKRHDEQIKYIEDMHRKQLKLVEDNGSQKEIWLSKENDQLRTQLVNHLEEASKQKQELSDRYTQKLDQWQREKQTELDLIRENHRSAMNQLRSEYDDNQKRMHETTESELKNLHQVFTQSRSTSTLIEQNVTNAQELNRLTNMVKEQQSQGLNDKQLLLSRQEQELNMLREQLSRREEEQTRERVKFHELIAQLEAQTREQNRLLHQEQLNRQRETDKVSIMEKSVAAERKLLHERAQEQQRELHEKQEELMRKQQRLLEQLHSERQSVAEERARLEVQTNEFETSVTAKLVHARSTEAEWGGKMKVLNEERQRLESAKLSFSQERQELAEKKGRVELKERELEAQQQRLELSAREQQRRSTELEEMTQLANQKERDGRSALVEARRIQEQHAAQTSDIETRQATLRDLEKRIAEDRIVLARERAELDRIRPADVPYDVNLPESKSSLANDINLAAVSPIRNDLRKLTNALHRDRLMQQMKLDALEDKNFLASEGMYLQAIQHGPFETKPSNPNIAVLNNMRL